MPPLRFSLSVSALARPDGPSGLDDDSATQANMKTHKHLPLLAIFSGYILSFASHLSAQTTLFAEDFEGDEVTLLNESVPDTKTDEAAWVASENFKTDGSFVGNAGSATLAFTPVDGVVYQLEASVTVVGTNANWLALGFVSGQSTTVGITNRFVNGNETLGRAWMLVRGSNVEFPNQTHSETTNDGVPWVGPLANAGGGDLDLRIVLDTTGGAGAWTATWFAKRPTDAEFQEVRSASILPNEEINAVGIALARGDVSGELKSFSLTSDQAGPVDLPVIVDIILNISGDLVLTVDRPAAGLQVARSNDLSGFDAVAATAEGNTLTIEAANVDPDANGADFFRVHE